MYGKQDVQSNPHNPLALNPFRELFLGIAGHNNDGPSMHEGSNGCCLAVDSGSDDLVRSWLCILVEEDPC
jgi:hypothetical protein